MSSLSNTSVLSLADEDTVRRAHTVLLKARRNVALENRLAAETPHLNQGRPQWLFAGHVLKALDGSILPPERRKELLEKSRQLGIRTFDANLVIAVVQDRARRGESIHSASGTLRLVSPTAEKNRFDALPIVLFSAATGIAFGLVVALIQLFSV